MSDPFPPIDPFARPAAITDGAPTCACCGQTIAAPALSAFDAADPLAAARSGDGIYQRLPDADDEPGEEGRPLVFHPVALSKVLVLYLSTFGVYQIFWAYRNWRRLRDHTGQGLSPFWRSIFCRFWGFVLFREVRDDAIARGARVDWRGGWMGALYLVLGMAWRLEGAAMLIGLGAVVPILVVQHTINRAARTAGVEPDAAYGLWHLALIAIVPQLLALGVYATFFYEN